MSNSGDKKRKSFAPNFWYTLKVTNNLTSNVAMNKPRANFKRPLFIKTATKALVENE